MISPVELDKRLLGKTEEEARVSLEEIGYKLRVSMLEGQAIPGICNYRGDRVNVFIKDGLITNWDIG